MYVASALKMILYDSYLDVRSLDEDHNKLIVLAQFKDGSKHFLEDYPEFKTIAGHCYDRNIVSKFDRHFVFQTSRGFTLS